MIHDAQRIIRKVFCCGDAGADPGGDGRGSSAGVSDRGGQVSGGNIGGGIGGPGVSDRGQQATDRGNAAHSTAGPLGGMGTIGGMAEAAANAAGASPDAAVAAGHTAVATSEAGGTNDAAVASGIDAALAVDQNASGTTSGLNASNAATLGNLAAAQGVGNAGMIGQGLDSAPGSVATVSPSPAEALANISKGSIGSTTHASDVNTAFANISKDMSTMEKTAMLTAFYGTMPGNLSKAFNFISPLPVIAIQAAAALGAALSGEVIGTASDADPDGPSVSHETIQAGIDYAGANNIDLNTIGSTSTADDTTDDTTGGTTGGTDTIDESLWEQFLDRVSTDLEPSIQQNTDFIRDEANLYNTGISNANAKDTALLETLANDLNTESGNFTPTGTSWGSYQPGTNFLNAKSLMSLSDKVKANEIDTASRKYETVGERSPARSTLAYLASLEGIAGKDETFNIADRELALKKYMADLDAEAKAAATAAGITTNAVSNAAYQDVNTPGVLEQISGVANTGVGLYNMGSGFGWWP